MKKSYGDMTDEELKEIAKMTKRVKGGKHIATKKALLAQEELWDRFHWEEDPYRAHRPEDVPYGRADWESWD